MVGPTLFGAIIPPSLVPQVLEKSFLLEIVENDICLASTSKQMPFFKQMCPKKRPQCLEKALFGFVGFRFSHIAQENVELQRNE